MTYRDEAGAVLLTFAVAAIGGALFSVLKLPAPWLTGSMVAVAVLPMVRVRPRVPSGIRIALFLVTGVSMGSGFTPETAAGVQKWPASLAALTIAVALAVVLSVALLVRTAKWDRLTAFFASVPGALSVVLLLAMRSEADVKLVVLAQLFRLFVLMTVLPFIVTLSVAHSAVPVSVSVAVSYPQAALQLLAGAAVGFTLDWLRFPGGLIVGGLLASAAIHVLGILSGAMPAGILVPCQIALGALIGERFQDMDLRLLRSALLPAAGSFLVAMAVSATAALAVAWALHLPVGMVLVAFAPGALDAMAMLALALGLDPAFVGVHQLARFLVLSLAIPFAARAYAVKRE